MTELDRETFASLQARLPGIWRRVREDDDYEHTSVVVPSLSVNHMELRKIEGAPFYEERLLFTLMRLRHPSARVLYVTSQPIHPEIVDYYLHLLAGVPAAHARRRLAMLCVYDASEEPLSGKILRRPRLIERIKDAIPELEHAYLTCNNSTELERDLAVRLGVPLNGVDPDLCYWGTKTGSRQAFAAAGVSHPAGTGGLASEDDLIDALLDLSRERPGLRRAVIKCDQGFAGEGNAYYDFPAGPLQPSRNQISAGLTNITTPIAKESAEQFIDRFSRTGGVVEELIDAPDARSPSVQVRIAPDGEVRVVSTHEQILGGNIGQAYVGCRFPANDSYRSELQAAALTIGHVLRDEGVRSRFGIDFVTTRTPDGSWRYHAIEINLRMTGTTHPYMALEFLTGGHLDDSGRFVSPRGDYKYYVSSDNVKSPHYRGLMPEDLMDIVVDNRLNYSAATETGVLFHMIGALSQYGKIGVTCIGNSSSEAQALYEHTIVLLDEETGARRAEGGRATPLLDRRIMSME